MSHFLSVSQDTRVAKNVPGNSTGKKEISHYACSHFSQKGNTYTLISLSWFSSRQKFKCNIGIESDKFSKFRHPAPILGLHLMYSHAGGCRCLGGVPRRGAKTTCPLLANRRTGEGLRPHHMSSAIPRRGAEVG